MPGRRPFALALVVPSLRSWQCFSTLNFSSCAQRQCVYVSVPLFLSVVGSQPKSTFSPNFSSNAPGFASFTAFGRSLVLIASPARYAFANFGSPVITTSASQCWRVTGLTRFAHARFATSRLARFGGTGFHVQPFGTSQLFGWKPGQDLSVYELVSLPAE